jgi:hypothetical protein
MGEELRDRVKGRYAGAARSVLEGAGSSSCCRSKPMGYLHRDALGQIYAPADAGGQGCP